MKKVAVAITMILLAGGVCADLMVNGSVEEGPIGVLSLPSIDEVSGWRAFDTSGSNSIELICDAAGASDEANYIQITSALSGPGLGDTGFDITTTGEGEVLLSTGVTYTVSFDAKWVSGPDNSLSFTLRSFEEDRTAIVEEFEGVSLPLNASWTTYSYEFTPTVQPTNVANGITLYIGFRPKAGGALQQEVICLDNIQVTPENQPPDGLLPIIYFLDLNYASSLSVDERYDVRHVAACLQGLANRDAPRAFLSFQSVDNLWPARLRESGGLCEGWGLTYLQDLEEFISLFSSFASGVVLYDPDPDTGVISSSLVATTAAGVEDAIAVRKDTSAGSMYNYLVNDPRGPQLPVILDLTEKFTGEGSIWQTSTPSTGSAKCDAYIWAKEKYIDTGKCDPTTLMYTLDLWGLKEGANLQAQLSNLDYAVQKKGFCFELSPWGDEVPNDDPAQSLGVDLATFKEILDACNLQTGMAQMIKVCGFINWNYKYTSWGTVGGSHEPVATEWEFVRILSAYNCYLEADAPGDNFLSNSSFNSALAPAVSSRRYVQNPAPTIVDLKAKGYIDENGDVPAGNYILITMGDYDQASWVLNWLASDRYDDPARGQVECSWAIDPNAIDRVAMAMDYMYRHKTDKDYFMAWDSGAGYVHPTQFYGTRSPSGYPDARSVWQDHCRKYYRMLDYSITGWLLNSGSGGTLSTTEVDTYQTFSGDGIGFNKDVGTRPQLRNNTPYQGRNLNATISSSSGVNFGWEREILWTPSQLKQKVDSSASNQHFLNAYEYYYLMRYYMGGDNNYRATWMSDTLPRIMAAGQVYSVTVTVRNDGWDTWSEENSYRLAYAILPKGSSEAIAEDYDLNERITLPAGTTVNPGERVTFSFDITAPSTNGDFDLYYDMVREGVTWFHEYNNIEWKNPLVVATNETDIDTDGDGIPDVTEEQDGSLVWVPVFRPARVVFGGLVQEYDGSSKPVFCTTDPLGLAVDVSYDDVPNAPFNPGSYRVVGIIDDVFYQVAATNTLDIRMSAAYERWVTNWFEEAEQTHAEVVGPNIYYDGDAYNNWDEYVAGTDPKNEQIVPLLDIQSKKIGPGEDACILNWTSLPERAYAVYWTDDLAQEFIPLQGNMIWPQSSYTDLAHEAVNTGYYRMDASLQKSAVSTATFEDSNLVKIEGINGDAFDGVVITDYSPLIDNGGESSTDWFSSPNDGETFFNNTPEIKFIEFNTLNAVVLTNLVVYLSGDACSGTEGRSIDNIKLYAGIQPGNITSNLVADVAVNADYDGTYGSCLIAAHVDLDSLIGQYFRLEFNQPGDGARILEIDAFSK